MAIAVMDLHAFLPTGLMTCKSAIQFWKRSSAAITRSLIIVAMEIAATLVIKTIPTPIILWFWTSTLK